METLTPQQLKEKLAEGGFTLLDVRTPEEVALAALPGALNIPMNELPQRVAELDRARPVIAFCHHGTRSEMAARFLERNGFGNVANLAGGIDAWSLLIDPAVPRY